MTLQDANHILNSKLHTVGTDSAKAYASLRRFCGLPASCTVRAHLADFFKGPAFVARGGNQENIHRLKKHPWGEFWNLHK